MEKKIIKIIQRIESHSKLTTENGKRALVIRKDILITILEQELTE